MRNVNYGLLTIIAFIFLYLHFYTTTPSKNTTHSPLLNQQNLTYSKVRPNTNDTLVGTYQTRNSISGFKSLILDSTYTYAYKIQGTSGEEIILTGSWELSYQNQTQHIILHRPFPRKAWQHLELANIEEHKFRVISDGLRDLYTQENYIQLKTNEYSLAIFK